ncbi:MAG: hypothetical protein ACFFA4_16555 [Promethearchaeota archaeon]
MKDSNILIYRLALSVILILIGIYILFGWDPRILRGGGGLGYLLPIMAIGGGIVLGITSPIDFSIKSERRKKLNLISQSDVIKMFECSKCGTMGATYFIKLVKDQILIKQRCPTHGGRLFRLPLRLKDQSISYFQNTIFLCFKCGQATTEANVKFSGPWTLINLSCPTHGISLPPHKIWGTVYNEVIKDIKTAPQSTHLRDVLSEKKKFCTNCGEEFSSVDQIACQKCGSKR